MNEAVDYYEILNVDMDSTPEEIKSNYKKLALVNILY